LGIVVLLCGCVSGPSDGLTGGAPSADLGDDSRVIDPANAVYSAKDGLENVKARVHGLRTDAVLVAVNGFCDSEGRSNHWEYYFDSLQGKKEYVVTTSNIVRERPYSFRAGLGDDWIDSVETSSVCGMPSGEFTLEVVDGTTVWTVISEGRTCSVDALSGRKI